MPVKLEPPKFTDLIEYRLPEVKQLIDLQKEKLTHEDTDIEATVQLINDLTYIMSFISILRFRNQWEIIQNRYNAEDPFDPEYDQVTNTMIVSSLELNMYMIAQYMPKRLGIQLYKDLYDAYPLIATNVDYQTTEIKQIQAKEIAYMRKHPVTNVTDMLELYHVTNYHPSYETYQHIVYHIQPHHFTNDQLIKHVQRKIHRMLNQWYQQKNNVENSAYSNQIKSMLTYDMVAEENKPNQPKHHHQSWWQRIVNLFKNIKFERK